MYNGNHDLGNGFYNVEILISQTDDLVISAQHTEQPDSFIIEIENMKVNPLENWKSAHSAFTKAKESKRSARTAKGWLGYVEDTARRKGVTL